MKSPGWLRPDRVLIAAGVVAAGVLACRDTTTPKVAAVAFDPSSTASSGFASTLVGRGNIGTFHTKSGVGDYDVQLKTNDNTDIAVSTIVVTPGGHSGWHYHPGPVLVVVTSGTITFYHGSDPTCSGMAHHAGTAFMEEGGDVGIARNEGNVNATVVATFFAPPGSGTSGLRIDVPTAPGNCSF